MVKGILEACSHELAGGPCPVGGPDNHEPPTGASLLRFPFRLLLFGL